MRRDLRFLLILSIFLISIRGVYGMSAQECFALAPQVGVTPHYGILTPGWEVSLGKPYGFEGLYALKAISLTNDAMTISINGEVKTLHFGESVIISGINFTAANKYADPQSRTKMDENGTETEAEPGTTSYIWDYCAFEPKETRLKLACSSGCIKEDTCLPVGTRTIYADKDNNEFDVYCDSNKSLIVQKEANSACINNYECLDNVCVNFKCKTGCDGCMKEDVCLPIGTRTIYADKDNNEFDVYCDVNSKTLILQKDKQESCSQHYECTTNLCVDGSCVSQNLLQKIISWFKSLFGD